MSPRFEVSDKVILKPDAPSAFWPTVPSLVHGHVYCVVKVNRCRWGNWWVHLAGVRLDRTKHCDNRGVSTLCFDRVSHPGINAQGKEAA